MKTKLDRELGNLRLMQLKTGEHADMGDSVVVRLGDGIFLEYKKSAKLDLEDIKQHFAGQRKA